MAKKKPAKKPRANVTDDQGLRDFLRTQEKLTEDYLGSPRTAHSYTRCAYTLVRDPKGNYCIVSEKECPKLIDDPVRVAQLTQFLNDLNELVSDYLAKHSGHRELITGPGVHVGTAEIFPK